MSKLVARTDHEILKGIFRIEINPSSGKFLPPGLQPHVHFPDGRIHLFCYLIPHRTRIFQDSSNGLGYDIGIVILYPVFEKPVGNFYGSLLFLELGEFDRPEPEVNNIIADLLLDLSKTFIPYLFWSHTWHHFINILLTFVNNFSGRCNIISKY